MNPSQTSVEESLSNGFGTNIAMSIMASGAISPKQAVDYLKGLKGIEAVLFGASIKDHISESKRMFEEIWGDCS